MLPSLDRQSESPRSPHAGHHAPAGPSPTTDSSGPPYPGHGTESFRAADGPQVFNARRAQPPGSKPQQAFCSAPEVPDQSPYEDVQDISREPRIVSQAVAQCERERQHPLPDLQSRKNTIAAVSACAARRTMNTTRAPCNRTPAAGPVRKPDSEASGNRAPGRHSPETRGTPTNPGTGGRTPAAWRGTSRVRRRRAGRARPLPDAGAVWDTDRHAGVWSSTPARKSRLSPTVASSVPCNRSASGLPFAACS